jgi:hypothetical protein
LIEQVNDPAAPQELVGPAGRLLSRAIELYTERATTAQGRELLRYFGMLSLTLRMDHDQQPMEVTDLVKAQGALRRRAVVPYDWIAVAHRQLLLRCRREQGATGVTSVTTTWSSRSVASGSRHPVFSGGPGVPFPGGMRLGQAGQPVQHE